MEAADIEELRRLFGLEPALNGIVLDRPENHNALSASLVADLLEALRDLIDGDAGVVLVGVPRGARVWSAGHDLTELPANGCDPLTYDDPLRQLVRAFKESPAPIIAMVENEIWGSACEVVMRCDLVVAAEGATFRITPAKLGVPYDIVGRLDFMQSVSLPIVKEMPFTLSRSPPIVRLGWDSSIRWFPLSAWSARLPKWPRRSSRIRVRSFR